MLDSPASFATTHPNFTYWLDEGVKLAALALGALWTYWNYRKSRTYAPKLESNLTGNVSIHDGVYVDISTTLKNTGASQFIVQQKGTSCTVYAILKDLSVVPSHIFSIFVKHSQIEPGESINDALYGRVQLPPEHSLDDVVWLRINQRVVSGKVEWNSVKLIRVGEEISAKRNRIVEGD